MKTEIGNLWDHHDRGRWVVVTTNIGWKKDGSNPMGAGIAKQAANRFPDLPAVYGPRCKKYGEDTAVWPFVPGKLILFPTKPLNPDQPWLSWKSDSDYSLIERSAKQLVKLVDILRQRGKFLPVVMLPMVGCGNGNLEPRRVVRLLEKYLDDTFTLVEN
jgi:hypothetical protein